MELVSAKLERDNMQHEPFNLLFPHLISPVATWLVCNPISSPFASIFSMHISRKLTLLTTPPFLDSTYLWQTSGSCFISSPLRIIFERRYLDCILRREPSFGYVCPVRVVAAALATNDATRRIHQVVLNKVHSEYSHLLSSHHPQILRVSIHDLVWPVDVLTFVRALSHL